MKIISYMTILTMSICDKIYERYEKYGAKFTLVHASKHQEQTAMIASVEPAKACAHIQATDECGYSLVCQALVCAVPMMRYRDHDHVHQIVHGSAVRRHKRDTSNFDRTTDLTTSVDAARPQLFAGVQRASLCAAVRSRSRSRAKFGARKPFPTRRSRAEEIELDGYSSPPLDSA